MKSTEYMKVSITTSPQDIINKYHLTSLLQSDGYIYLKIKQGMCGLKQAVILLYDNLVKLMEPHGYEPVPFTSGIWRHKTRQTKFYLCVDDCGIKYCTMSTRIISLMH